MKHPDQWLVNALVIVTLAFALGIVTLSAVLAIATVLGIGS